MGKPGSKHGELNVYFWKSRQKWAYAYYVLGVDGKRRQKRETFSTEAEALTFKKKKDAELAKNGAANSIGPDDTKDAIGAKRILSKYCDITLTKAALFYEQHHPLDKSITVEQAVESYLEYRKPEELSSEVDLKNNPIRSFRRFSRNSYIDRVKPTLEMQFKGAFGDRAISSVMTQEIVDYFRGRGVEPETYNNKISNVKVFYDWCIRVKKCCQHNPAASIDKLSSGEFSIPVIYKVEEIRKVFEAAATHDPQFVPYLALAAFAGIRLCEIKRMNVADVDFEHKVINIRPLVAKSKGSGGVMPRKIEGLPEAIWKWLEAAGGVSLVIDTKNLHKRRKQLFEKAGVKFEANAFRHSFATYGYAYFQSDAIVRKQTGHKIPNTFFKYYATSVLKSDGEAYFGVLPSVQRLPEKGIYKARYTPKIDWPEDEQLIAMTHLMHNTVVASTLGVSETAVRKRLKKIAEKS